MEDELLLQKLRASRRRFQRRMQRLLEKERRPSGRREGALGARSGEAGLGLGCGEKLGALGGKKEAMPKASEGEGEEGLRSREWESGTEARGLGLLVALGPDRKPFSFSQYDQPFEDAPVVQMATLTYETPQVFG
ncbi:hypothetical protein P7K49_013419 [Saguinus oedipus]|uniref:Uncharacterized protein n=1 Tax=Saguinus oedipus TaxID=9490 RepID=A0ABQ9VFV9_SAGOE|nr:hypothetical protein P7K49_013419 [Saguinus oedipus]